MSAQTMLLPYLEQQVAYDRVNFHLGTEHPANTTSRSVKITTFICASDPAPSVEWGGTNYPFMAGGTASIAWNGDRQSKGPNGIFFQISKIYIGDIKDGSSRTMMAMEWTRGQAGLTSAKGAYAVMPGPLPDPLEENADRGDKRMFDRGASWMSGGFMQTLMTQTMSVNAKALDLSFGLLEGGLSSSRSYHPGGVNIMMCDGSVQFVSEHIDRKVLDAMATRDGRETI
jgi:prepilin-type processing-associated H-X9-DG protein